jgi:hypothetical protein
VFDVDNERRLKRFTSFREYFKKTDREDTDKEGQPTKWVRSGTSLYLYPTPDDEYSMEVFYYSIPDEMSDSTDTTELDDCWDEIILKLAVIKYHIAVKDFQYVKILKDDYYNSIRELAGIYDIEKYDTKEYMHANYAYNNYDFTA